MPIKGAPNTESILTAPDGKNRTGTALSTNIIILVDSVPIGAIQSMSFDESRQITTIDEVGTDGHIDSAPSKSTDITGSCKRIRFDGMRIATAFRRGFVHVAAQRQPFDIQIIDKWQGDGDQSVITIVKNVWFNKISYAYQANEFIISDDAGWTAETIFTTVNGNSSATQGGARGFPLDIHAIEQQADIGNRRGSLDAPGLLKSFLES